MLPDIYFVGATDWSVRKFHGYDTAEGSSYNSYLILDQFPTIIDSVKAPFSMEQITRIEQIVPLDAIKYLVINHAEGDHTSALPILVPYLQNATIVCNQKCKDYLIKMYPTIQHQDFQIIDARSELVIGKRILKFIPQTMLHWPESMWTYSAYDEIIFTNDGFGQHIASCDRWADELPLTRVMHLLREYIANILGPFPGPIRKCIDSLKNLKVSYLLTAHGLSWRNEFIKYPLEEYNAYANRTHIKDKILIIYDTMYGNTAKAVKSFAEGVRSMNFQVVLANVKATNLTQIALHSYDAAGICVASPTFNSGMMPLIDGALGYLRGLTLLKGKLAYGFVNGGWNWKALNEIVLQLENCKCEVYDKGGFQFKCKANDEQLNYLFEQGRILAKKCKQE
ncbi:A-type flavoprotein [Spironucleus salmonicida]|nr:A-type flavoprotein [Spironucleus salmonicida]